MNKIIIGVPNDSHAAMVAELYDGDWAACEADNGQAAFDLLADCAFGAGLNQVKITNYGAEWEGTDEQIAACRAAMPAWAYVG